MLLGLRDPDLDTLVRGMDPDLYPDPDPYPSITVKNSKKNLDSYFLVTSLWLLSLKSYVHEASKSNKQKILEK